jgi:hypothetical protein
MTSDKMSATPDKLVEFKECERFSRRNALPEQSIMPVSYSIVFSQIWKEYRKLAKSITTFLISSYADDAQ